MAGGRVVAAEHRRGLQHGQRKAFDPEPVEADIASFGFEQLRLDFVCFGEGFEQCRETLLAVLKKPFVVPEGVVGVEGNGG
jgi:hypothetical protein